MRSLYPEYGSSSDKMEGWIQKYKDMRGFGLAQFGLLPERCGSEEEYQRRMLNLWTGMHKNMESPKPAIMKTAGGIMGVVQKPCRRRLQSMQKENLLRVVE